MHKYLCLTYITMRKSRKTINLPFIELLDSLALKHLTWVTVAVLILYRLLMGEWFVLLVCGVGGALLVLLQQHWKPISRYHRKQFLFGLVTVLSWCLLTAHLPAYALFFDTLEKGLTTLFARYNVTGIQNIPGWIGGVFRIIGIVFLAILAIRFGRSREDDDEAARAVVGKVVQIIAGLLIFDALIELFTG